MLIDRAAVHAALAAGATVVTPSRRLARALKSEFDAAQGAALRAVWPAADVLPWEAWIERSTLEAEDLDVHVLSPLQEAVLWRRVVAESPAGALLLQADAAADTARDAWRRLHEYQLGRAPAAASDDQHAFHAWAASFEQRLQHLHAMTAAQLPAWLARVIGAGRWRPPQRVLWAGFDALTPQQAQLARALQEAGVAVEQPRVERAPAPLRRLPCADARAQWQAAAAWAQARLQARPDARLAIVVPDLGAQRDALVRALTEALCPSQAWQPQDDAPRPFNLSLGAPLASAPLVAAALGALDLLVGAVPIAAAGRLLRAPFLREASHEWARRARLDRRLREDNTVQLDLLRCRRAAGRLDDDGLPHADAAPLLAARLARLIARRDGWSRRARPSEWAERLFGALDDLGFPGDRTLSSPEYQTHQRWRALVASLATLDALVGPLDLADAVAHLRRAAADTLFQPESPPAPVQVLGALEAAHLQFDALWIAQLTDDLWPPAPDPNPLLPYAAQRAAGIPGASAESALEHAQKLLDLWCRSADEVLVSHPLADGERELVASGLIAALPAVTLAELDVSVAPPLAQRARSGAAPETLLDPHGARVDTAAQVAGGTRIVADQSACAFRAFAVHRLGARELAEPSAALTPAERGGLLHATLAAVWRALRTQAALAATDEAALQPQVEGAADEALARVARQRPDALGPRLQALERRRLTRTVLAWLALERERPPFEVIAIEEAGVAELAGLRIDVRPDRVDRLADGTVLIIDYKTGAVSTRAWLGERPDEPQLPLYAISSGAPVSALAFAQVRSGALEWKALAAPGAGLPQATVVADDAVTMQRPGWRGLMVDWRAELERLAAAFVRGDAQVAPKGPGTCRYCALPALCRLSEREPEAARIEAGAEPGAGPGGTPERNGD